MTDEEKRKELTRSSFAAQMAMLGYEPNGNPKDMVEIVRCKDCKYCEYPKSEKEWCKKGHLHGNAETWFCADGKRR
jgi:hypothetical protein